MNRLIPVYTGQYCEQASAEQWYRKISVIGEIPVSDF